MRKLIIILVAFVASYSNLHAQKVSGANSFIVRGGINYPGMFDCDSKMGYLGGVEFEHYLTKRKALSVGAMYNTYKVSEDYNGKRNISLNYISVPVMYQYYVVKGLCLKAGVEANFLVHDHVSGNYGFTSSSSYEALIKYKADDDDTAKVNKARFSIPFGLSYEYSNIILDLRAEYGLTDVSHHDKTHYTMNTVFMTLGYRL